MTKRTEQKDLFLAALRGDAKAQRACTAAGKACGGRCIPKHWNCRIKGEGKTPPTRGNAVQLSTEQKEKIQKARNRRRTRRVLTAVGSAAVIGGSAAGAVALGAKNPALAIKLRKKAAGVSRGLGVASSLGGPAAAGVAGVANMAVGGFEAGTGVGLAFARRGRELGAFKRLTKERFRLEKQIQPIKTARDRSQSTLLKAQERLGVEKTRLEAAKVAMKNKGKRRGGYAVGSNPQSIAQTDRARTTNLKSAETAFRRANTAVNSAQAAFNTRESAYQAASKKLNTTTYRASKLKSKLYKSQNPIKNAYTSGVGNAQKSFRSGRRMVSSVFRSQNRRGPKSDPRSWQERFSRDEAERTDKKCGNSGIPEKAKCTKGAGSAAAPQKPGPQSAGFIAKHKKHGGYSPSFFKSLNKAERAEFKALNEYAGSKKGRRERELQAIGGIAKGVAKIAAVGAVGGYGTAKALQAINKVGKGKSKQNPRQASYVEEKLKQMRKKGTGKYGSRPRRKTGGSFRPDIEAMQGDAEGKKYSKTVTDPKTGRKRTVKYGAKGYTIAPGTKRGNSYCARSFGDMKSHNKNCGGKDRNTPLCLSRAKWKCSGKNSR